MYEKKAGIERDPIPCMWIFRKSLLLIPTYKYIPTLRDSQLFQKIIDFLKLDKYPM